MAVKAPTHFQFHRSQDTLGLPPEDRRVLALAALFGAVANLLVLTGPLFMLLVYDRVLASRSGQTLVALTVLMLGLYLCHGFLDHVRGRLLARLGARLEQRLAGPSFDGALDRAAHGLPAAGAGLEAVAILRGALSAPVAGAAMDLPWTPLFLSALYLFHPALGWFALAGGAGLVLATLMGRALARPRALAAGQAAAEAAEAAQEALAAAEFLRAQGMAGALAARWRVRLSQAAAQGLAASDRIGALAAFGRTARMMLQSGVLALGAWLVLQGEIGAGAMIAASILLGRALAPVDLVLAQWPLIERVAAAYQTLRGALAAPMPAALPLPAPKGRLCLSGVWVQAGDRAILRGVDLTIRPGEALGVIGPSGAGKSTLARIAAGALAPDRGSVRLDGGRVQDHGGAAWGRALGYLPQEVPVFADTVARNIARMLAAPDAGAVRAAARAAGLHEAILTLPQGYDTLLGPGGWPLSGGERQRLGLARALYGDPVLLVLDEPNSALDSVGTAALLAAVGQARARGAAVLVAAHRPGAVALCDRLAMLEAGLIVAEGPRDEVLRAVTANAAALVPGPEEGR